jgi:hypothetical protein
MPHRAGRVCAPPFGDRARIRVAVVKAPLNKIECSITIQNEGFENLVCPVRPSRRPGAGKAPANWYLEAQEAKSLGLVEAVL